MSSSDKLETLYGDGLFEMAAVEHERIPRRPLGELSDYVVEQFPEEVYTAQNEALPAPELEALESRVSLLCEKANLSSLKRLSDEEADLASLDLNILVNGLNGAKAKADKTLYEGSPPAFEEVLPSSLVDLANHFAERTGKIPALSYEDVILINPLHTDARTVTPGETGRWERAFYLGHAYIEVEFAGVIEQLQQTQGFLDAKDQSSATDLLVQARLKMLEAASLLRTFRHDLPDSTFNDFRPYFFQVGPYVGPSGRWTARLPQIDAMLTGDQPESDRFADFHQLTEYFPREGRQAVTEALAQAARAGSIRDQIDSVSPENFDLRQAYRALAERITSFRRHHMTAVQKKLGGFTPEMDVAGTGGVIDVESFLKKRISNPYF